MRWLLLLIPLVLAGCAATPLNAGAHNVRLTNDEPGPECEYRGEIAGSQGSWWEGPFTTNARLEEGARNDLKNDAIAMGANVVQVIATESGISSTGGEYGGAETTVVTYVGAAYRCPTTQVVTTSN